jgi:hypothetical protein
MKIMTAVASAVAIPLTVALAACGTSTGTSSGGSSSKAPTSSSASVASPRAAPSREVTPTPSAPPLTPKTLDAVDLLQTLKVPVQAAKGTGTSAERSAVGWWDNKQAIVARTFSTHTGMLKALAAVKPAQHTAVLTGKDWLVVLIATPYGQWANEFAPEPQTVAEDLDGSVANVWP